ncbi:pyrroline-5-carboxylate reductase 3 [Planococcus citri]|uniref:pyrroline-5-carboxylate reductase 3 n=1 Tax=Planococcus citri TaxID=170843 RepID=UPI0031F89115
MNMKDTQVRIGFIGAGNMAQAIGFTLIDKGLIEPSQINVSAPSKRNFKKWDESGVNTMHDNGQLILNSDIIFLAMKPQYIDHALKDLHISADQWTFSKLVVSVIAGFSLETLHEKLRPVLFDYRLIKAIPNTALLVGAGFTAICPDPGATEDDIELITKIMSAGGSYEIVPEHLMHAMSALSGSGIAYLFNVIEALSDGAVKQGIPRSLSYKVAAQTVIGAAQMVLQTGEHPAVLKDNVCSPGGMTICGVHALEQGGLRASLINALEASTHKSMDMNKKK